MVEIYQRDATIPAIMGSTTRTIEVSAVNRLRGLLGKYFYFFMSLLVAAVVVYGFSHTIDQNLIHAVPVRPWILYLHGIVFSGWVAFFIVQSALVRVHKVSVHRTLGWFGVALGVLIPVLGISTAITMDRFNILHFHENSAAPFFAIQLNDMVVFAICFGLAVLWRSRPEFHRRLLLVATCALTSAAFARFPGMGLPMLGWTCVCVDLLIFLGVVRDLIVNRRIHQVYLYALPALIVAQSIAMYLFRAAPPQWLRITHAILGV
ncbi:hypothetical protein [Edaphobacter sp.]|uniref:hypothetical protein n=1 Tax=Edaphobacter sp. TaxID=1934404 RepID=UPI002DBE1776|nr:hypothetical protein [Edaphobacter sp.]HEU5341671.1 hypothetical protein [Edaphobacter sp.]